MNATTVIPTDLVTPLGAYLRLRPENGAAFFLESVEHGRLGRHSFVGYGTRIVSFEEAETLDEPVVGYGPFVMNTEAEIRQAVTDYQHGKIGGLA
jgi:hypothetical protein